MPDDRFLEPEIETMPRASIEALQEERILELVPYVYERSPLIRKTWEEAKVKPSDINSLADFTERVPFITKDDIRRFRDQTGDPFGGLLCTRYADATTVFSTSGTTGDATLYGHAWDNYHPFWAATARDMWEIGMRPGDYVLGSSFKMRGAMYHADHLLGAIPVMVNTAIGGWASAVDAIRRYRPVYAQLTALSLAELEHVARTTDMRELFSSFKGAGFAGEPLSARSREQLKSWGVEVFVWTSTGDVTGAFECREHDGCHAWEDCVLLEAVDPAGSTPVADGELGELVAKPIGHRLVDPEDHRDRKPARVHAGPERLEAGDLTGRVRRAQLASRGLEWVEPGRFRHPAHDNQAAVRCDAKVCQHGSRPGRVPPLVVPADLEVDALAGDVVAADAPQPLRGQFPGRRRRGR